MDKQERYKNRMREVYDQLWHTIQEITGNEVHHIDLVAILGALGMLTHFTIEGCLNSEEPAAHLAVQTFLDKFIPVMQDYKNRS